jgi:hypothetical protein
MSVFSLFQKALKKLFAFYMAAVRLPDLPDMYISKCNNMAPNVLKSLQNIAKQYFQDFCRLPFSSLLKTPDTQKKLGTTLMASVTERVFKALGSLVK